MITSDQSQIGFIGVPMMFLGILVGAVIGASRTAYTGWIMLGAFLGMVAGIAIGVAIQSALRSAGAIVAGIWFFLAPLTMIAGGVLGARRGERDGPRGGRRHSTEGVRRDTPTLNGT